MRTLIILFILFSSACTHQIRSPIVSPNIPFVGLEQLINYDRTGQIGNETDQQELVIGQYDTGTAVLIATHGMCYQGSQWIDETVQRIRLMMDMEVAEPTTAVPSVRVSVGLSSKVKAYKTKLADSSEGRVLVLYTIMYDEVAKESKQSLCFDSSVNTPLCNSAEYEYPYKRASINANLKSKLLNDCFSDAVFYLGEGGEHVRNGVQIALDSILANISSDSTTNEAPIAFLSESLGSKVLTDAIVLGDQETVEERLEELRRTSIIFLGANQIPLLNIGKLNNGCSGPRRESIGGEFENEWISILSETMSNAPENIGLPKSLIAFNDPNDLLSYPIREGCDIAQGISVINIFDSNAGTFFGIVENPEPAHLGYRTNEDVLDFIRYGHNP